MKTLISAIILLLSCQAYALDWQDSPEVGHLFERAGVHGTFVLYDVTADRFIGYARERAETRFVPASTFKIANSLIGLSTGAVASADEILPYGGQQQPFKAWEQDMSLRAAIRISNVPVYQELARRIGLERMRANMAKIRYGNGEIGDTVDTFWLTGPLQISAVEQVQFLAHLAQGTLPFPAETQATVRELIRVEQQDDWTLYSKTGWKNEIGWWVGWILKQGRIYCFALNMDITQPSDADKRVELGKASLKILGMF